MDGSDFLTNEAGIAAYVYIGQNIDLEDAAGVYTSITTLNSNYIIGRTLVSSHINNLIFNVHPYVYVNANGWIIAYYKKDEPAGLLIYSDIVSYQETTTTLEYAIQKVCNEIGVDYDSVKANIQYYDFEFPDADSMLIFYGKETKGYKYIHISIPSSCTIYEASYYHYLYTPSLKSGRTDLYIDGQMISQISVSSGKRTGNIENLLTVDDVHTIKLVSYTQNLYSGVHSGFSTVLIYKSTPGADIFLSGADVDFEKSLSDLTNSPPTASFTYTTSGLTVTFDALSSYDPDGGQIVSYYWDFGDGNNESTTSPTIQHTYSSAGTYTVTLTVEDDDGLTDSYSTSVSVDEPSYSPDPYEPDDTMSQASYISIGSSQHHNFHDAGDVDWIKFYASSSCTYTIETYNLGDNCDTYIYLYDSNNNQIESDDDSGNEQYASKIEFTPTQSGYYYVKVRHYFSSTYGEGTDYWIRVDESCLSPTTTTTPIPTPTVTPTPGTEVTRSLPSWTQPNSIFQVTLTSTASTIAMLINETIPSGFTFINYTYSGADNVNFQQSGNTLTFAVTDVTTGPGYTITYTLQAPSTAGSYTFSGTYQAIGGSTYSISGDTTITVSAGETVPDNVNDTLEQIVSKYYPSFDWTTDTPTKQDVLQAVIAAVSQYFSTNDPAVRQEILNDIIQLVALYFTL